MAKQEKIHRTRKWTDPAQETMLRLDSIGGVIRVSPANKRFDYREIPKRLEAIGWERDKALEKEVAYQHEHIYRKEFQPSKVNDAVAVVIARVSENKETFKFYQRLGVAAVEVLSYEGEPPYDTTDLKDMLHAIDLAVFDLYHEGHIPFVSGFKFHGNRRIYIWNRTKDQIWLNWTNRNDLHILETEREFFLSFASEECLPANLAKTLMEERYPDEPKPNL